MARSNAALALRRDGESTIQLKNKPEARLVRVTPQLAVEWLTRNTLNRPLKEGKVEQYAKDMKAGRWQMNGETVKFTRDGDLMDGQNRLWAVSESGITVDMMVVEGLDPNVMPTIDTGAPRSMGDVLAIGGTKNANVVGSALRWLAWYHSKNRNPSGGIKYKTTHQELLLLIPKHQDVIERASEVNSSKARKFVPASILTFVFTMAYRTDPAKAHEWLHALETGIADGERHPVHQLRERMIQNMKSNAKLGPVDVCALTVRSWNHLISGKRTKTLRWTRQEEFPEFEAAS